MLEFIEEPLQSRLMQNLMQDSVQDGGDYYLACFLIQRFGIVPHSIYPESFNSSNSAQIDTFLTSKLREYTLELRAEYGKAVNQGVGKRKARESARNLVPGMVSLTVRLSCSERRPELTLIHLADEGDLPLHCCYPRYASQSRHR
jgi:bleomycin hydrolase